MMTDKNSLTIALLHELLAEIGQPFDAKHDPAVASLQQIGLDSLSVLELLMLVDERCGVEIAVEDLAPGTTLIGLAALIDQRQAG
jgi:acyl carrier protein